MPYQRRLEHTAIQLGARLGAGGEVMRRAIGDDQTPWRAPAVPPNMPMLPRLKPESASPPVRSRARAGEGGAGLHDRVGARDPAAHRGHSIE